MADGSLGGLGSIGSAFVSIIPTFQGGVASIASQLTSMLEAAGDEGGTAFTAALATSIGAGTAEAAARVAAGLDASGAEAGEAGEVAGRAFSEGVEVSATAGVEAVAARTAESLDASAAGAGEAGVRAGESFARGIMESADTSAGEVSASVAEGLGRIAPEAGEQGARAGESLARGIVEGANAAGSEVVGRVGESLSGLSAEAGEQGTRAGEALSRGMAAAAEGVAAKVDTEISAPLEQVAVKAAQVGREAGDSLASGVRAGATQMSAEVESAISKVIAAKNELAAVDARVTAAEDALKAAQSGDAASADAEASAQRSLVAAMGERAGAAAKVSEAERTLTATQRESTAASEAGTTRFGRAGAAASTLTGKLAGVGKSAMTMGTMFAGFEGAKYLDESIKSAQGLQREVQVVQNASGDTSMSVSSMSQKIIGISNQTGASTEQVAKGLYTVEAAGYKGADAFRVLGAGMKGSADEGADSQVVLGGLTTIMRDYGIKTTDSSKAMNEMLVSSGNTKASLQEFSGSLASVFPTASALGLKLPEVSAAISQMTQRGFSAQRSTQDLNHAIVALANPTAAQAKEMKAFGLSSDTVRKSLGKNGLESTLQMVSDTIQNKLSGSARRASQDLQQMDPKTKKLAESFMDGTKTAGQLQTAMGKLSPAQQKLLSDFMPGAQGYVQALTKMTGGNTSLLAALSLTGQGGKESMDKLTKADEEALKSTKDLDEKFNKTAKTASMSWQILENKFKNVGVQLATAMLPTLSKIALGLAHAVDAAEHFYSANKSWLNPLISGLAKVVAGLVAVKVGMSAASKIGSGFKWIGSAVKDVGSLAKGFASIPAKAMGGISKLKSGFETVRIAGMLAKDRIASGFTSMWGTIVAGAGKVKSGFETIRIAGMLAKDKIVTGFSSAWSSLSSGAARAGGAVASGLGKAKTVLADLGSRGLAAGKNILTLAANFTKAGVSAAASAVKMVAVKTAQLGIAVATRAWAVAQVLLDAALSPIGLTVIAVVALGVAFYEAYKHSETFRKGVQAVGNFCKRMFTDLVHDAETAFNWIKSHWQLLLAILSGPFGLAVYEIKKHWTTIKNDASEAWNWIKNEITKAWDGIKSAVSSAAEWVKSKVVGAWNDIKSTASSVWNGIKSTISNVWNGIKSDVSSAAEWVKSKVSAAWNAIKSTATSAWDGIKSTISNAWNAIKNVASSAAHSVEQMLSSAWNTIKSTAVSAWNTIKSTISNAFNTIKSTISNAASSMLSTMRTAWNNIVSAVETAVGRLLSTVRAIPGKIKSALGNMGSLLVSAGRDLVNGLINGIESMAGSLMSKVAGLGSKVAGAFKGAMKIFSPSRVMADLGQWIPKGVAQGIDDHSHHAENSMVKVADRIAKTPLHAPMFDQRVGYGSLTPLTADAKAAPMLKPATHHPETSSKNEHAQAMGKALGQQLIPALEKSVKEGAFEGTSLGIQNRDKTLARQSTHRATMGR